MSCHEVQCFKLLEYLSGVQEQNVQKIVCLLLRFSIASTGHVILASLNSFFIIFCNVQPSSTTAFAMFIKHPHTFAMFQVFERKIGFFLFGRTGKGFGHGVMFKHETRETIIVIAITNASLRLAGG